jgi:hypothetical protein
MKKRTTVPINIFLITVLFAIGFVCLASPAQDRQRKFTAGEMIDTGGGISAKILGCRGVGDNEECEVQYYRGDALESTPRWENASFLRRAEERMLNYKRQSGEEPSQNATREVAQQPETTTSVNNPDCSFTPPTSAASRTDKPSEQLFKRKIYDAYHIIANGTGSAPLRVGVTFINFTMKPPFSNEVRVVPGLGARRINDAAPPNTTIYPVISKHIVCEQYRDRTYMKQVENKYACFKNRDGEWVCGADGIPKISQLN